MFITILSRGIRVKVKRVKGRMHWSIWVAPINASKTSDVSGIALDPPLSWTHHTPASSHSRACSLLSAALLGVG